VWAPASTGITGMFGNFLLSIAIDPTDTDTLYAGTYGGFFKSTDGAASWSPADTGLTDPTATVIAIDPTTPTTLYAGTFSGVFKSVDGAATWSASSTGITGVDDVFGLVIDPTTTSTLYAATNGGSGLHKSTDGGANWSPAATGLPNTNVLALVLAPNDPSRLYAGTQPAGVSTSADAATTWTATGTVVPSDYVTSLAIDPTAPAILFAGTILGPSRSTNGGTSWSFATSGLINTYTLALTAGPTGTIYGGFSDGLYRFITFCGDGVLDPGEECDDGNPDDGDCCSHTCDWDPPGLTCFNEGDPCTVDRCDGVGNCLHAIPAPGGCSSAVSGKSSFMLQKSMVDSTKDAIQWKWTGIDAVDKADFGAPSTSTGLTLCISDASISMGLTPFQGGFCGTKPCWSEKPTSHQYKDKAALAGGITSVQLKSGAAGKAKIQFKAKGANLGGLAGVTLDTPLLVRLVRSNSPICWEAVYSTTVKDDGKTFKAKSD
jgi:cysteine-rich repeat protein